MDQNRYTYNIIPVPGIVPGHERWWITVEDAQGPPGEGPTGLCLLFSPACTHADVVAVKNLLSKRRIVKASVKKLRKIKQNVKKYGTKPKLY